MDTKTKAIIHRVQKHDKPSRKVNDNKIHPETISKLDHELPKSVEPNIPEPIRTPTDVFWLVLYLIFLTILLGFIGYCAYFGDIGRLIYGYDNCGFVCGRTSDVKNFQSCYDVTYTGDKRKFGGLNILLYNGLYITNRYCIQNCSEYDGYTEFLNRCLHLPPKETLHNVITMKTGLKPFLMKVGEDFRVTWPNLLQIVLFALLVSIILLILLPFWSGPAVWIILTGVWGACIVACCALWLQYTEFKDQDNMNSTTFLILSVLGTIITLMLTALILIMIKRIRLAIKLFQETGKALIAMPVLFVQPILATIFVLLTILIWTCETLLITTSGYLTMKSPNVYHYKKNWVMWTAAIFSFTGMLWTIEFIMGCQYSVVAGAVSKWYFERDKTKLSHPIRKSTYNLTRYHLGSVALGSLLIFLVRVLRILFSFIQKLSEKFDKWYLGKVCVYFCGCFLWLFQKCLNIATSHAYVITAIHGYPLLKAGKQAFTHITAKPIRLAAINNIGAFVLFLFQILVVACTVAMGAYTFKKEEHGIHYIWIPLILSGLFSYFIARSFANVYKITMDTIFICFCEDSLANNGITKPFFMSRGLMEFVEKSNSLSKPKSKPKLTLLPKVSVIDVKY